MECFMLFTIKYLYMGRRELLKFIKILVLISTVFVFSACQSSDYVSEEASLTLHGVVDDGYISGATLCLDVNLNNTCDSNEPSTTSDANGLFSLSNIDTSTQSLLPVLAFGGVDTSTKKAFKDHFKAIVDLSNISSDTFLMISPLSDLVAISFLNRDANSSAQLQSAKTVVADALGLTTLDLNKDPMKNINLFVKSQELQHTKRLLKASFIKHAKTPLSSEKVLMLENKIKQELVNQNLNLTRVLIALEVYLETTIPENEKTFITAQITELKNKLGALSQDTSLAVDNLNRLQKSIDTKQSEAIELLNDANSSATLNIVPIDTTTESITQSIFDTTDALLDEQACSEINDYNMLSHSALQVEKSEDTTNGIAIASEYPKGESLDDSQVQIFYPMLESTLDSESVIVFQDNYYFVFDKSWTKNSKKTIYVRTPKNEKDLYSCYRFELNFSTSTSVNGTKVFRYSDI